MASRADTSTTATAGLGRRIRNARIAKDWTQGDLAGSNYSVGFISRIESGARRPSRATLTSLAARLGVTVDFLLTGMDPDVALTRRHDLDRAELALAGGDIDAAMTASAMLLAEGELAPWPDLERRARLVHALAQEAQGDVHAAIIELEDLYDVTGDGDAAATVGIALSRCYREVGDSALAITAGERALTTLTELGLAGSTDHVRLAVTVAAAYFESGEVGVATRLSRRAIEAADTGGSPEAQAAAYWNASIIERHAGNLDGAVRLAGRALAILQGGAGTRNLGRLRTQLALFHVRRPDPDLDQARSLLDLAAGELDWSAASPVDVARNLVVRARLHLAESDPLAARGVLERVSPEVCHQDALLAAEVRVVEAVADSVVSRPDQTSYDDAATLLELFGVDRGAGQLWFELGEAMRAAGDLERSSAAFRQAAVCLGASRVLLPTYDRPAFTLTMVD